jgi:uncharacterized protein (TIGR02246 family)
MSRFARGLYVALLLLVPGFAFAGSAEDANAVVDQWVTAYSANDREALVRLYSSDAILLGTTSPVISKGTDAIHIYFQDLPDSGRRNVIVERHTVVLGQDAVLVTGLYDFSRKAENYTPRPSRFSFVVEKRDGRWLIVHHHSSPRSAVRQ